jgi:hypothetical protein
MGASELLFSIASSRLLSFFQIHVFKIIHVNQLPTVTMFLEFNSNKSSTLISLFEFPLILTL